MGIITNVSDAVDAVLGTLAEQVAKAHPVILRQRKFTAATLARTFILGFLAKPSCSDEELAQVAALCGVEVTTQAIEQRHTPRLAAFLEVLFREATRHLVGSRKVLAPLLQRFTAVWLLDSTTVSLPDALRERFPGCGGSHGGGQAAMKLQVRWDLRGGALDAVGLEPGRDCDYKTPLQVDGLAPGSLRIADLGYFDTEVFGRLARAGVYWLSRLHFGTADSTPGGQRLAPLEWLGREVGPLLDRPVRIGVEHRVACRILAWRVPEEVANRRRQELVAAAKSKDGRVPSRERLAWCDWTILVTNAAAEQLTVKEAAVLYGARWQVELLFKRWKSLGMIAELSGSTAVRQMIRVWSRLLAVLMQHRLLLSGVWGDTRCSLVKACAAIRRHALVLATAVGDPAQVAVVIEQLGAILRTTARRNKRKKLGTFELLENPELLPYPLT